MHVLYKDTAEVFFPLQISMHFHAVRAAESVSRYLAC